MKWQIIGASVNEYMKDILVLIKLCGRVYVMLLVIKDKYGNKNLCSSSIIQK